MTRTSLGLILLATLILCSATAFAATPFQFAAPGLRAPDDPAVSGIRFTVLQGNNDSVGGVDFGLLAVSETGNLRGFSAVLGVGRLRGNLSGCASGLVNIHEGTDRGVNAALVNRVNTVQAGANIGFVNVADGYTSVDIGGLNVSDRSTVQLGVVNVTQKITGVQIGFLNVAENGFLPVFPLFNFPTRR